MTLRDNVTNYSYRIDSSVKLNITDLNNPDLFNYAKGCHSYVKDINFAKFIYLKITVDEINSVLTPVSEKLDKSITIEDIQKEYASLGLHFNYHLVILEDGLSYYVFEISNDMHIDPKTKYYTFCMLRHFYYYKNFIARYFVFIFSKNRNINEKLIALKCLCKAFNVPYSFLESSSNIIGAEHNYDYFLKYISKYNNSGKEHYPNINLIGVNVYEALEQKIESIYDQYKLLPENLFKNFSNNLVFITPEILDIFKFLNFKIDIIKNSCDYKNGSLGYIQNLTDEELISLKSENYNFISIDLSPNINITVKLITNISRILHDIVFRKYNFTEIERSIKTNFLRRIPSKNTNTDLINAKKILNDPKIVSKYSYSSSTMTLYKIPFKTISNQDAKEYIIKNKTLYCVRKNSLKSFNNLQYYSNNITQFSNKTFNIENFNIIDLNADYLKDAVLKKVILYKIPKSLNKNVINICGFDSHDMYNKEVEFTRSNLKYIKEGFKNTNLDIGVLEYLECTVNKKQVIIPINFRLDNEIFKTIRVIMINTILKYKWYSLLNKKK